MLSNCKHSGVPEDSKSPTLGVLGFTPTLGQSGVATGNLVHVIPWFGESHMQGAILFRGKKFIGIKVFSKYTIIILWILFV